MSSCSVPSSVEETCGYPGGKSLNVDGLGNTSGAGFVDPEETSGRRRREETASTGGFLKSPADRGEGVATADAITRGAEDKGRADHDIDRRRFLLGEAQQTGPLGGSRTLKPARSRRVWPNQYMIIEQPTTECQEIIKKSTETVG
ncbi:hypothetical protein NDU88_001490 [Pleurodeles waltl]|uniref:Uncharacterized protein n=1 Tax=Pleurodeles waltl TaxID=8319 RepID=A0AAV7TK90_PLEWA|nr:hypothetical protein NDU88_001490 [Pleurodeles waltl]